MEQQGDPPGLPTLRAFQRAQGVIARNWLASRLGFYEEDTLSLKTRAHFRGDGMRPSIELEPTDHPFAVHQREGISLDEAWKIIHRYMD